MSRDSAGSRSSVLEPSRRQKNGVAGDAPPGGATARGPARHPYHVTRPSRPSPRSASRMLLAALRRDTPAAGVTGEGGGGGGEVEASAIADRVGSLARLVWASDAKRNGAREDRGQRFPRSASFRDRVRRPKERLDCRRGGNRIGITGEDSAERSISLAISSDLALAFPNGTRS